MPFRVPNISTVVIRHDDKTGKNVRKVVEPGKPFNFSDDEIVQITAILPGSLRKPLNESAGLVEEPVDEDEDLDDDEDESETDDTEEEGAAAEQTANKGTTKAKKPKAPAKPKKPASEDDDI